MTPGDATRVLTLAASYDQRTIGEADALAWAKALGDINQDDACDAVTEHYRNETRRLMPADVINGVRRIREARLSAAPEQVPDADPDDVLAYQRALREQRHRVADGTERQREVTELVKPIAERKALPKALLG